MTFMSKVSAIALTIGVVTASPAWADFWSDAGAKFKGVTLHGVTESTPPSNYIKDVLAPDFEKKTGIKVELETTSWDQMYDKAIKDMEYANDDVRKSVWAEWAPWEFSTHDTSDGGPALFVTTPWREGDKLHNAIICLDKGEAIRRQPAAVRIGAQVADLEGQRSERRAQLVRGIGDERALLAHQRPEPLQEDVHRHDQRAHLRRHPVVRDGRQVGRIARGDLGADLGQPPECAAKNAVDHNPDDRDREQQRQQRRQRRARRHLAPHFLLLPDLHHPVRQCEREDPPAVALGGEVGEAALRCDREAAARRAADRRPPVGEPELDDQVVLVVMWRHRVARRWCGGGADQLCHLAQLQVEELPRLLSGNPEGREPGEDPDSREQPGERENRRPPKRHQRGMAVGSPSSARTRGTSSPASTGLSR